MLDLDALGPARRAGGVDDVGAVVRAERADPVGVGEVRVGVLLGGEAGGGHGPVRHAARGPVRDDGRRTGVVQHERHPLGGQCGVDRQVGGTGLEDGQQDDDQLRAVRQHDGDGVLGADAPGHQCAGQPVGGAVDLPIAEGAVPVGEGHPVGSAAGLLLEEGGQGGAGGGAAGGGVRVGQGGRAGTAEQVDGRDRGVRRGDDGVEDGCHPGQHLACLSSGERLAAVGQFEAQPLAGHDDEAQRIVRGTACVLARGLLQVVGQRRDPQTVRRPGRGGAGPGIAEGQEGVEQGAVAARPLDVRQAGVVVAGECRLLALDPVQQGVQRFGRVQPDAHRHGVDEQADHVLDPCGGGGPYRHGLPEDDVGAARHGGQHQCPGHLGDGVEGDSAVAGGP